MYRIVNNICPDYLKKTMPDILLDVSCRDTRSTNCNHLYTPKPNCELIRKPFMYFGDKMETLQRPLNYQYYYCQSVSVFCIDLVNVIHMFQITLSTCLNINTTLYVKATQSKFPIGVTYISESWTGILEQLLVCVFYCVWMPELNISQI